VGRKYGEIRGMIQWKGRVEWNVEMPVGKGCWCEVFGGISLVVVFIIFAIMKLTKFPTL
jgi:hypothetical protein